MQASEVEIETPFGTMIVNVYPSDHRPQVSIRIASDPGNEFRIDQMELQDRSLEMTLEGKWS